MERIILIITLLIAVSTGIQAQASLDSLMNRDLDEVVVTAQRKYTKPTARGLKVSMSGNPLSKIGSATDAIMQMPLIDGSAGSISVLGTVKSRNSLKIKSCGISLLIFVLLLSSYFNFTDFSSSAKRRFGLIL